MIRVLIVEDDPMVAELNRSYLTGMEGFELAGIASNGREAVDFLRHGSVSLALLDVFMPGIDGFALLESIRAEFRAVDAIMVTAARRSEDIQQALRLGVVDYLVKPFTRERFQAALLAYRQRYRLLRSEGKMDQEMIDKRIFTAQKAVPVPPKGIDAETLALVRDVTASFSGDFSVKDVLPKVGLSRISLKKYLVYLNESGELGSSLVHMQVGRPHRVYFKK